MSSLTTFIDCPAIQTELERFFCTGRNEPVPIIEFLFSPQNNGRILNRVMQPGGGKRRTVQLTYFRRLLESEVSDGVTKDCPTGPVRGHTSRTYELDETDGVQVTRSFNIHDLAQMCMSNEDYRAKLFMDLIDGLTRKMETQAATSLWALAGRFSEIDKDPDGTDIDADEIKKVKTLVSSTNPTQFYNAHEAIMQTARMNLYCSAPVVIGEYEIVNYYRRNNLAGCCADIGIDLNRYISGSQPIVLPSYRLPVAAGNNNDFLTLSAGAALPIWFNVYEGDVNVLNDDSNFAGTLTDPQTGITFDLRVTRICDDWNFTLRLPWDIVGAPDDMFENSDPQDGNVFIHKHRVVNS